MAKWSINQVKLLHPTWHRDVIPSQYLGLILKKLKPTQQKRATYSNNVT